MSGIVREIELRSEDVRWLPGRRGSSPRLGTEVLFGLETEATLPRSLNFC